MSDHIWAIDLGNGEGGGVSTYATMRDNKPKKLHRLSKFGSGAVGQQSVDYSDH